MTPATHGGQRRLGDYPRNSSGGGLRTAAVPGRWRDQREYRGGEFHYNSAVTNISNTHITNVYNRTVINRNTSHSSFNGAGGTHAKPSRRQEASAHEEQVGRTPEQENHARAARGETSLRASENRGRPEIAATRRPGEFRGPDVVRAREAGRRAHERPERPERGERHPEGRR